jgi:type IV fimbrial biogenesis protein FimT
MKTLLHNRGITLIELMTTISVVVTTLSIGVPTFNNIHSAMQRGQVTTELMTSFMLARSEAARHAISVTVCASATGTSCASGDTLNWPGGWIVFTDANENHVVDADTDEILHVAQFDSATFRITPEDALINGVTFHDSGYPDNAGNFNYSDSQESRTLALNYIGRIEQTGTGPGSL